MKDDTNTKANEYIRAMNTQISSIFNDAVRYNNEPKNREKQSDEIGTKKGKE